MACDIRIWVVSVDSYALIESCVRAGFDRSTILEQVQESAVADGVDSPQNVESLIDRQLQRALIEQRGWERPCDLEKLQTAFEGLEAKGFICRHDEGPTLTWSRGTLSEEVDVLRNRGINIRGHVFYHSQDRERAVEDRVLLLAFGGPFDEVDGHPRAGLMNRLTRFVADRRELSRDRRLGREIVRELSLNRLPVFWNSDPRKRIRLPDFTWRVPRDEVTTKSLIHFGPKLVARIA